MIGFGPGQLDDGASVEIKQLTEAELPIPTPKSMIFGNAFNLDVQGSDINGALQMAAPVDGENFQPGDEVFFFRQIQFPNELGEMVDYWPLLIPESSGLMAWRARLRRHSPGLSQRGNVVIAKSAQPLKIIRIEFDWVFNPTMVSFPL